MSWEGGWRPLASVHAMSWLQAALGLGMTDVTAGWGGTALLPVPARWCYRGYRRWVPGQPGGTWRQGNQMNRRLVHGPRLLTPILPAGRRTVRADGQLKIRAGAIMWIAGPVLFLIAQLAAQSAWRTPYSWMANPLSDLALSAASARAVGIRCLAMSVRRCMRS
jgi:hypothetical protein